MDQVAAAADLSKAALYSYFPSKDFLPRSLLERYPLLPELPEMMASLGDTPPALGIPTLIAEIWRLLRQRKELARVISREIQSKAESGKLFVEQISPRSYQSLAGYLDRWMNRGVLRRQNALAAAERLIGMLWSFLLTPELIGAKDFYPVSDETVVTTVARMFLDGYANPAKHSPSGTPAGGGWHQGYNFHGHKRSQVVGSRMNHTQLRQFRLATAFFTLAVALLPGCKRVVAPQAPPPATVTVSQPVQRNVIRWDQYSGYLSSPKNGHR